MAQNLPVTIEQGATFRLPMRLLTSKRKDAAPVDLTGFHANMDVRDSAGNLVVHLSSLAGPTGVTALATAGGALASGTTYYYSVSAVTAQGETQASAEVSATPSGGNLSVALSWSVLAGAAAYNVYRGTSAGAENVLIATVNSGSATGYTDAGEVVSTASPPTTNTAMIPVPALNAPSTASGGQLTSGQPYYYVLTAFTAAGETTASAEVTATPGGSNLSVALAWNAVGGAAGYRLYRGTVSGTDGVLIATVNSGTAAAYTDNGATTTTAFPPPNNTGTIQPPVQQATSLAAGGSLTSGQAYYYVVTSKTAAGESVVGVEKSATPSGGNLKVVLAWTPVAGAAGYNVYRSTVSGLYGTPSLLATIGSGTTATYTDDGTVALSTGAPPGNTAVIPAPVQSAVTTGGSDGAFAGGIAYYWVVTALTEAGETVASNEHTATPAATNHASLSWGQVSGATGYNVYRSTTSGSYGESSLVATVTGGSTVTYSDLGAATTTGDPPPGNTAALPAPVQNAPSPQLSGTLTAGVTYFYLVTATTAAGETTAGNQEFLVPAGTNLAVRLTWAIVEGATGYRVYRSTSAGNFGTPSLLATITSGTTVAYVDDGTVSLSAGAPPGNTAALPAPTTSACSTSTTGGALAAGTYHYAVTSLTANGETVAGTERGQVTTGDTSAVTVNWSADTGAAGYKVYRGTASGAENVLIATLSSGATSFTDYGETATDAAAPGTNAATLAAPTQNAPSTSGSGGALAAGTYFYVVTALTALGETAAGNEKSQAATGGTSVNTVNWSGVTGATGYRVYRGTAAGQETQLIATLAAGITSFEDTGGLSVTLAPPGAIYLGGKAGTVLAQIAAATTQILPTTGTCAYDLFLDSPAGIRTKRAKGDCTIEASVTALP